ncbi:hypothetical protein HAZT_HAZT008786 [Hyalella azteca]|uniref:Uncharacterized protein n=1 Tax=Hyalella azteca TaxID=294128 RepID=A0A6A0H8P5_HYAAZ|nr:hypothetical protein HAZT_HAZT008786 [Hyalella azteca]
MDSVPGMSQLKSVVQLVCGDPEGAQQTQDNFTRQCLGVSQVRSLIEVAAGDRRSAFETHLACVQSLGRTMDSIPVIGHLKGLVHLADRDAGGCATSMKSATRTWAIAGVSALGFCFGGPAGAALGGIAAGGTYDSTLTALDSEIEGEFTPYGIFEVCKDPKNPGKWCDALWKVKW